MLSQANPKQFSNTSCSQKPKVNLTMYGLESIALILSTTMYGPEAIVIILLILTPQTDTKAPNTNFGLRFLVLPPVLSSTESYVIFYLTTYHGAVYVLFNQEKYNGSSYSNAILVERDSVTSFYLNKALSTSVTSGRLMCHDLKSDREFSVAVFLGDTPTSMAVIKLVPVVGWGTSYYAVTLASTALVVVMTQIENIVTMVINSNLPSQFAVYIEDDIWGGYYTKESSINFNLHNGEGYIVSMCHVEHVTGYLTGSAITSTNPVGVISGSCYSGTVTRDCGTNKISRQKPSQDIVAEMLLPQETYGQSFIIPEVSRRVSRGSVIVVGAGNLTFVSMHGIDSVYLLKSGDWAMLNISSSLTRGPRYLNSSSPIQVIYVQNSRCWSPENKDRGDVALTLVLPVPLYYHTYYWGSSKWPADTMEQYVIIIIKHEDTSHLRIDGAKVAQRNIDLVSQLKGFNTGQWWQMDLRVNGYFHYIYTYAGINFNCLVLGISEQTSSMYNAGFRTNKINQHCVPDTSMMMKGDGLDNDCDGLIDEEIQDLQDNDNDGIFDEDLSPPIRGEWGEWHSWTCLQNCRGATATRQRFCNDPPPETMGLNCPGKSRETRRNYCNTGLACPEDCPDKTFGLGCQMSCENCRTDCSKVHGTCVECEPGFMMPQNLCSTECPTGTYGLDCSGNCMLKCGGDCSERVQGNCFGRSEEAVNREVTIRDFTQFFPLIVSIMPLAVLFAVYRRAERERRERFKSMAYLDFRRKTRRSSFVGSRRPSTRSRRSTVTHLSLVTGSSFENTEVSVNEIVTLKDPPVFVPVNTRGGSLVMDDVLVKSDQELLAKSLGPTGSLTMENKAAIGEKIELKNDNSRNNDILKVIQTGARNNEAVKEQVAKKDISVATLEIFGTQIN